MVRVLGVIATSILLASMLQVSASISTKTGVAPSKAMTSAGGDEGKRGGDDFIARLDAKCHQGNQERLGTGGYRDAVLRPRVFGQLAFELSHFRAHDVLAVVEHAMDVAFKLRTYAMLLRG
jgi:hypothetical protein